MSWEALRYGVHTTYSEDHPDYLVYNPSGGLGFLDGFIIDAHFRYDILIINWALIIVCHKVCESFTFYTPIIFCLEWHFLKSSIPGGVVSLQWTRSGRTISCSVGRDAAAVPHLARFRRWREYSVSCHSCRIWCCDNRKGMLYYVKRLKNQWILFYSFFMPSKSNLPIIALVPNFLHAKHHKIQPNYHWIWPLFCSYFYLIEGHRTKRRGIHRCYSCTPRSPFYLLLNQQCFIPLPHERRPDRTQKSKHIILPQENADERAWELWPCTYIRWHLLRKTQK